ncbi:MAG: hypothetical protein IIC04_09590, partial [Proteobacteria bacterium]|nr:hypothetical protein [Pseudomonadota bacterium]
RDLNRPREPEIHGALRRHGAPPDAEVRDSYHYARNLGLEFEAVTHEKNTLGLTLGL